MPRAKRKVAQPATSRNASLLEGYLEWLRAGKCYIRPRSGGKLIPLVPNPAQWAVIEAISGQIAAGAPVRVIVLKARQLGVSTLIQTLWYYIVRESPHTCAQTLAHTDESSRTIFQIARRAHSADTSAPPGPPVGNRRQIRFAHDSSTTVQTAGGHYPAVGGTINYLHISELSRWQGHPTAVREMLTAVLNAVPEHPDSAVVIESTASMADACGEFEQRWNAAVSGTSEYAPVFQGWHREPSYRRPADSLGELSPYERDVLAGELKLDREQIAWYRHAMHTRCGGSEHLVRQEYPSTPAEAFQAPEGRIFPMLTPERHNLVLADRSGWELYRGIDWGGGHPFVCLWIAHRHGDPALTVDIAACPNCWRQLTTWSRDAHGRPAELGDDAVDALRYLVTTMRLTGHVHVYRELFVHDAARRGLSELDLAGQIARLSEGETIIATVADRSRPTSIILFAQQGIPCIATSPPASTLAGEVEDGITMLAALMLGTVPLNPAKLAASEPGLILCPRRSRKVELDLVQMVQPIVTDPSWSIEEEAPSRRPVYHPYLGLCH